MFTHLGNGCPMQLHRHDNIVQRVLSLAAATLDQFHRRRGARTVRGIRQLSEACGSDRCIVVTDAIAPAGLGPGRYTLGRWDVVIDEDMVPRAPDRSHFIGSGVTMRQSAANLLEALQLRQLRCGN